MPNDLIRSRGGALAPREQRRLSRDLAAAQLPAKRATARVQAAAFTAFTGLVCTEALTALEVQAVRRQGAVLDDRAKAIVDCYAGLVTTELARLSLSE
jgi:hypothetical protein